MEVLRVKTKTREMAGFFFFFSVLLSAVDRK